MTRSRVKLFFGRLCLFRIVILLHRLLKRIFYERVYLQSIHYTLQLNKKIKEYYNTKKMPFEVDKKIFEKIFLQLTRCYSFPLPIRFVTQFFFAIIIVEYSSCPIGPLSDRMFQTVTSGIIKRRTASVTVRAGWPSTGKYSKYTKTK